MDQITDHSDLRKYRTELPNIIDDLGLDVFERALYGHYKRVCGANGGTCYESTRTTASKIPKMSAGKISLTRRQLVAKGLLKETPGHTIHVEMVDIWDLNFAFYSYQGDRPDIAGWTIPQLQEWVNKSVYHINSSDDEDNECLPGKQTVYVVNSDDEKCLPGKTKNKQLLKKEPTKEGAKAPPSKAKSPKTKTPPAVKTFREAAHRYPPKAWYSDIDEAVGSDPPALEFWYDVVKEYVGMGWNPTNVKNMLDFYTRKEIPGNGNTNNRPTDPGLDDQARSISEALKARARTDNQGA